MYAKNAEIRQFIERFAQLSANGTPEAMAAQFGEMFLAAGPQGAKCVRNEDFARMLPQRKHLFDRAGLKKTDLVAIEDSMLNARYAFVKTRWRFQFERSGGAVDDVFSDSIYLVDCGAEPWQIVLYLANQDILATLRQRGLLQS